LRLHPPYLVWISIGINIIGSELLLREASQQCANNPYEICILRHELLLRDIPGKLIQSPYLVWISIGINTIASELALREANQ
jgi:hypothetical protein